MTTITINKETCIQKENLNLMTKELVFGHQNPDTDTIASAMAFAYYQNQLGYEAEAVALGEPNDETKFALNQFGLKPLRVIETAANEVESVMLVDHNEPQQSVSDLDQVSVSHVVDHHRINGFNTAAPLYMQLRPFGSVSTILTEMFQAKNINIPAEIAGMLLSGLISDTLLLKSPTTTDHDREALPYLAKLAGVDAEKYGLEMLKAGTNLAAKSDEQIVDGDAKTFELGGTKVRIGQVNTVDLNDVFDRQADLETKMNELSAANGYDTFLLVATNILDSDSELLFVGANADKVEAAFNAKLNDQHRMALPGVVSRKKQVVPPLTAAFEG